MIQIYYSFDISGMHACDDCWPSTDTASLTTSLLHYWLSYIQFIQSWQEEVLSATYFLNLFVYLLRITKRVQITWIVIGLGNIFTLFTMEMHVPASFRFSMSISVRAIIGCQSEVFHDIGWKAAIIILVWQLKVGQVLHRLEHVHVWLVFFLYHFSVKICFSWICT